NGAGIGGGNGRRHPHHHHHHRHHHPGDNNHQHQERSRLLCPTGLTDRDGVCTHLQTDAAQGGRCATALPAPQRWLRGVCFPTDSCPATIAVDFCQQSTVLCSAPDTEQTPQQCSCARSLEGDVVCVDATFACPPGCSGTKCSPRCASSAECAP